LPLLPDNYGLHPFRRKRNGQSRYFASIFVFVFKQVFTSKLFGSVTSMIEKFYGAKEAVMPHHVATSQQDAHSEHVRSRSNRQRDKNASFLQHRDAEASQLPIQ
jgi:hypothetical protein